MDEDATADDFTTKGQPPADGEEVDKPSDEDLTGFDDDLTEDALQSLKNATNQTHTITNLTRYDPEKQKEYLQSEWWYDLRHFANDNTYLRTCYYLATTYRNAMTDLRKYYHIRYLYYDNLEYEVGYVTHEIIFKYQIVLELFHLMQRKFEFNQDRHTAPITYMLYIYTNILYQSTDIIHLCNMMHEIEAKYKNYKSRGVFADDVPDKDSVGNRTEMEKERAIAAYQKKLAAIERKVRKEQKKRMKMIKQGKIFSPTIRTTRTYKKMWDLHYGWSIETW
ncbi:uncharacterized protein LOC115451453 [Manduca sexta]|nr:uncharacterized protein LOC115451453 [Manduca sexta]